MKKLLAAVWFAGVVATLPAWADDSARIYVGLDAGTLKASTYCNGIPATVNNVRVDCQNSFVAQRIAIGMQPGQGLGVELSYTSDMGSGEGCMMAMNCPVVYRVSANVAQLSATYTLPVYKIVSIIGKAGVARATYNSAATTNKLAGGLGIQFDIFRKFSLRAQYENLGTAGNNITGKSKLEFTSIGWLFRF